MRPDNKKPHSGQLQGNDGHLLGVNNGRCSLPHYNNPAEIVQDCQQFERDVRHFASISLEPRVCVYGIPSSVPFARGWH